nr:DUF3798 domain-containing protein [uncultured Peptostreptococcus sp.]
MSNKLKKIATFISIFFIILSLSACSKDNKIKKEILDSDSDKEVCIAVLTDNSKDDYISNDIAQSIREQYETKVKNKLSKTKIINYMLPEKSSNDYYKEKKNLINVIEKNRDINGIVVSTSDKNILSDISYLKKNRKDLLLVSANQASDYQNINEKEPQSNSEGKENLLEIFDMNFKTGNPDRTSRIAELAKSMGADRLIVLLDEENQSDYVNGNIEGVEKQVKLNGMSYEEVRIPKMTKYKKKAYISSLLDSVRKKYGDKVSYYSTSKSIDDVLVSRITENSYYIVELSQPNRISYLLNKFGIKYIHRQRTEYAYLNSLVSAYLSRINNSGDRVGSSSVDPKSHTLRMAIELAANIVSKGNDIKKAYNPYFLEKISTFRTNINASFYNVSKGTSNYKYVDPDQYIY